MVGWLIKWLLIDRSAIVDWLVDRSIDRLIDWLINRLIGWLIDWLIIDLQLGSKPYSPDAPRPQLTGRLCPISIYGSPVALLKFQMALRLILLMSSGSKKKESGRQQTTSGTRYEPATFQKPSRITTLLTKVFDKFIVNRYCTMHGVTCLVL